MEFQCFCKVNVGQGIAADYEERIFKRCAASVFDATGRTEWNVLDRIVQLQSKVAPVSEVVANGVGQIKKRRRYIGESVLLD